MCCHFLFFVIHNLIFFKMEDKKHKNHLQTIMVIYGVCAYGVLTCDLLKKVKYKRERIFWRFFFLFCDKIFWKLCSRFCSRSQAICTRAPCIPYACQKKKLTNEHELFWAVELYYQMVIHRKLSLPRGSWIMNLINGKIPSAAERLEELLGTGIGIPCRSMSGPGERVEREKREV